MKLYYEGDEYPPQTVGSAAAETITEENSYAVAHLWLPDPESRSGWYIRKVDRMRPVRVQRSAGFRRD